MPGFKQPVPIGICVDAKGNIFEEKSAYEGPNPVEEYARRYRWLFETLEPFGSSEDRGILLNLKKCSRPTIEYETIKIHHGQDVIYRPGKSAWSTLTMSFYEVITDEQSSIVAEKIYKWHASGMVDHRTSLHGNVRDYLKDAVLYMLDGVGKPVYVYNLYNCWIQKINPSELDYSDNNISEIELTVCFDKAIEVTGNKAGV